MCVCSAPPVEVQGLSMRGLRVLVHLLLSVLFILHSLVCVCVSLGFAHIPLMTHKAEPFSVCFLATWVSSLVKHLLFFAQFSVPATWDSPLCWCVASHSFSGSYHVFTDRWLKCRHFSQSSDIRNHGCLQARG